MKPWLYLNVFGWKIPVFRVKGILDDGVYGYYDENAKYIGIDSGLSGVPETHTLVHEMFHAALDRLHCQQQLDEKFVEVLIENLTVALMENFKVKKK